MEAFPVDYEEWRLVWEAWKADHTDLLRPCSFRDWPAPNMLATEILGRWDILGRSTELSEVTMPDFTHERRGRTLRFIGITYATWRNERVETYTPEQGIVATFEELEAELRKL